MNGAFYFVNPEYIAYLKGKEISARGFTTVPNVEYTSRNKFLYGAVLEINELLYYVPVSSYSKRQQDNYLIKVKRHHQVEVAGSLRFNYMIPVPEKCLELFRFNTYDIDTDRKTLLEKEYRFCKSNAAAIEKKARKTYDRVISGSDEILKKNSCDFALLEKACREYAG